MIYRKLVAVLLLVITSIDTSATNTIETPQTDIPHFVEEAATAGLSHRYTGPWEFFVGGGAAGFDCNADRMPDLFLAGGEQSAALYVNQSQPGGSLRFKARAIDVSESDLKKVLGAYPINIDNDAHMDLVVLRLGRNLILRGLPDCQFTKMNRSWAFDGGKAWSTAFAATWEDDQQFPTLAIGNYVDRTAPGSPWGTCDDNQLYRSTTLNGSDSSTDYSSRITLHPGYCALSLLFTDWNNTGVADLRVTNDRQYHRGGQEQLWRVPSLAQPRQYTQADGWRPLVIWGMSIAEADLNSDGLPEYALSSMGDTLLQTLDDSAEEDTPVYRDIAFELGATAHRPYTGNDGKPSTGWHTRFDDLNNDGRLDLFIAKGNVESMPDFASFDPDNLLLGGYDEQFHEAGLEAGLALDRKGRGAVVQDFNADGMLDLLVMNRGDPVSLFRNQGAKTAWGHRPMGNWLGIELHNGAINPQAVGARVIIKTGNHTQTRQIQIGGGHASGQTGFVHVGLGVAERASIRVRWPNGDWSHEYRAFANQFIVLSRDDAAVKYWYPRRN